MEHMEFLCDRTAERLYSDTVSGVRYHYNPRSILAGEGCVKYRVSVDNLKPGAAGEILRILAVSYCTHKWFQTLPVIFAGVLEDLGEFHFIVRREDTDKFISTMHLDFVRLAPGRAEGGSVKIKIEEETAGTGCCFGICKKENTGGYQYGLSGGAEPYHDKGKFPACLNDK